MEKKKSVKAAKYTQDGKVSDVTFGFAQVKSAVDCNTRRFKICSMSIGVMDFHQRGHPFSV